MKKFLAVVFCCSTILFGGCGENKTAEQPAPSPQVEQGVQTPAHVEKSVDN